MLWGSHLKMSDNLANDLMIGMLLAFFSVERQNLLTPVQTKINPDHTNY
jgi:hypothetical protein